MESVYEKVGKRGREIFLVEGFCCSESVLLAIAESRGIQSDHIPGIATGFCGGVSHTSGICGAASGAVMGIGLLAGRKRPDQPRDEIFGMVQEFLKEFGERFGSSNCAELLGCDLNTPEGREKVKVNNLRARCADYVEAAAGIAARILEGK